MYIGSTSKVVDIWHAQVYTIVEDKERAQTVLRLNRKGYKMKADRYINKMHDFYREALVASRYTQFDRVESKLYWQCTALADLATEDDDLTYKEFERILLKVSQLRGRLYHFKGYKDWAA